jgi:hypothetical protein
MLVDEGSKENPPMVRDEHWYQNYFKLPAVYPGPLRKNRKKFGDENSRHE